MKKLTIVVVLMIMSTCLISQSNFCFDSIQIKEIRRKVDNGVIYKQLSDSLSSQLIIERRMHNILKNELSIEKEQTTILKGSVELYQNNEKLYTEKVVILKKQVKVQKTQKIIISGIAVILGVLAIL